MTNRFAKFGGQSGIAICLAGFVLVFLGWNGAATYDRSPAQFPYLISGGLAGLGLIIVGATLLATQSLRADQAELRATIDELRTSIEQRAASAPGRPPAASDASAVVVGRDTYHLANCRLVEGQDSPETMPLSQAAASGRTPCRICAPDRTDRIQASS